MFDRFIVLGDSFSEGLCDEQYTPDNFRGWADRVAENLATLNSEFTYVNLAIRGKLLHQVAQDQLPVALTMIIPGRTLVSFHAGANDLLRPKFDTPIILEKYRQSVQQLTQAGATVMLFTVIERAGGKGRTADRLAARFAQFNVGVRESAKNFSAVVVDAAEVPLLQDRRFFDADRLHLNPEGHSRVARAIAYRLGLTTDEGWRDPLPAVVPPNRFRSILADVKWAKKFLLPWLWRRIRGRSSGDGRSPKYPEPLRWDDGWKVHAS